MLSATVTKLAWTDPRSTTASHSTAATAESSTGAVRQLAGDDQSQHRVGRRHSGCRHRHVRRRRCQLCGHRHILGDGLHRCRHRRGARQSSGSLATASRKLRQAIPHSGCLAAPYTARIDVVLLYGPDSPGALILTLFWDKIDSGEIAGYYQNLVAAIKSRGEKAGKVPKIVFTTYPQPLPSAGQSDDCFEVGDLARDELDYLSTFENTLKATLRARRAGSPACRSPRCPASCRGTSTARAIRGRTGPACCFTTTTASRRSIRRRMARPPSWRS